MRAPSDAQAALLRIVEEFDATDYPLFWPRDDGSSRRRARVVLWTEEEDREANRARVGPIDYRYIRPRRVTLAACVRHGWVDATHERVFAGGLPDSGLVWRAQPAEPIVVRELTLTEDGALALALWQQRKLTAPAPELPMLAGRDREIVTLDHMDCRSVRSER
jgi:hypothetical protein